MKTIKQIEEEIRDIRQEEAQLIEFWCKSTDEKKKRKAILHGIILCDRRIKLIEFWCKIKEK